MRLHDLLEDADDEIIARLRALARRDLVPSFHPSLRDLPPERHRAFLDADGSIVAAWPTSGMMTHAEIGDYHGGRMPTISPLAKNVYNCVILYPPNPRLGSNEWRAGNDNMADNRPMPIGEYVRRYSGRMTRYAGAMAS